MIKRKIVFTTWVPDGWENEDPMEIIRLYVRKGAYTDRSQLPEDVIEEIQSIQVEPV